MPGKFLIMIAYWQWPQQEEEMRMSGISLSQDATIKLALKGLLEVTEASGKNIEVILFCLDGFCGWTSQYLTDNDLTFDVLYFNEILYLEMIVCRMYYIYSI